MLHGDAILNARLPVVRGTANAQVPCSKVVFPNAVVGREISAHPPEWRQGVLGTVARRVGYYLGRQLAAEPEEKFVSTGALKRTLQQV